MEILADHHASLELFLKAFLAAAALVISAFMLYKVIEFITERCRLVLLSKGIAWLGKKTSGLGQFFSGLMKKGKIGWLLYVIIIFSPSALASFLVPILAVPILMLSFIPIYAVYKSWVDDEELRKTLEDSGVATPQLSDYRLELLIALFALIVTFIVAFDKIDQSSRIYEGTPTIPLLTSVLFIYDEIVRALPFLGALDGIGFKGTSGVLPKSIIGQSSTFILRFILDIVLIGSIIRIAELLRRATIGADLRKLQAGLISLDEQKFLRAKSRLFLLARNGRPNAQKILTEIALGLRTEERLFNIDMQCQAAMQLADISEGLGNVSLLLSAIESLKALSKNGSNKLTSTQRIEVNIALCDALTTYAELRGEATYSEQSLATAEATLSMQASGSQDRARLLFSMASALKVSAILSGRSEQFEESINTILEAHSLFEAASDFIGEAKSSLRLADLLIASGERGGIWERLPEAIGVTEKAILKLGTQEKALKGKLLLQQGIAERIYSAHISDESLAINAIKNLSECISILNNNTLSQFYTLALIQRSLAHKVLSTINGQMGQKGERVRNLERTVNDLSLALSVLKRELTPSRWAMAALYRGHAISELGLATKNAERTKKAVLIIETVLEVRTRVAMPAYWAGAMWTLGIAQLNHARLTSDVDYTKRSIASFEDAMEVRNLSNMKNYWLSCVEYVIEAILFDYSISKEESTLELANTKLKMYQDEAASFSYDDVNDKLRLISLRLKEIE